MIILALPCIVFCFFAFLYALIIFIMLHYITKMSRNDYLGIALYCFRLFFIALWNIFCYGSNCVVLPFAHLKNGSYCVLFCYDQLKLLTKCNLVLILTIHWPLPHGLDWNASAKAQKRFQFLHSYHWYEKFTKWEQKSMNN